MTPSEALALEPLAMEVRTLSAVYTAASNEAYELGRAIERATTNGNIPGDYEELRRQQLAADQAKWDAHNAASQARHRWVDEMMKLRGVDVGTAYEMFGEYEPYLMGLFTPEQGARKGEGE